MKELLKNAKKNMGKILATLVLISFIAPIGFLIFRIATTPNTLVDVTADGRVKSDYILMLLECILGIFAIGLPGMLTKKFSLEIPDKIYYLYVIFPRIP